MAGNKNIKVKNKKNNSKKNSLPAKTSKLKRKLGLIFLVGPIGFLAGIFILFIISSFVFPVLFGIKLNFSSFKMMGLILLIIAASNIIFVPLGIFFIIRSGLNRFSIIKAFGFSWQAIKKNIWFLILVFFVIIFFQYRPDIFRLIFGRKPIPAIKLIASLISYVLFVLAIWLNFGAKYVSLKIVDAKPMKPFDFFPNLLFFVRYLICSILYILIVLLGLYLFIIPGLIWFYKFKLYPYFILDGFGPIAALKKSSQATAGAKIGLVAFVLLAFLINLAGFLLFRIGLGLTLPFTIIAGAHVYRQLQTKSDIKLPDR